MPLPIWIHCNICSERQAKSWHISSCGKIVCQNCLKKLKVTHCGDCKGPCKRTIELNSKAPKEVQKLFGDVGEEIKKASKIINFQDKQKAKFLLKLKNNNANLDKRRSEMKKVKEKKLGEIEEVKRRLAAAKEEIKRKNSMIKLNNDILPSAPEVKLDLPAASWFQRIQRFFTSTPVHHETQIRHNSLDGPFMKLETPAAFHCQEERRRREEADRVRLDRKSPDRPFMKLETPAALHCQGKRRRREEADRVSLSLDRKSPDRMSLDRSVLDVRSPVMRVLDELLESDSPVKLVRGRYRAIPNPRLFK